MIIVNRVAELIIKYRSSDLTKAELQELGDWLGQSFEHLYLFRDLTDDDYLCGECARATQAI